MKISGITL